MVREITYTDQDTGFEPGRRYANPRYFSGVRPGVRKVYIKGHWPSIAEAYRVAGVTVVQLDETAPAPELPAPREPETWTPKLPEVRDTDDLPSGWRDLPWPRLRSLAAQHSATPVHNREEAIAALERHEDRA